MEDIVAYIKKYFRYNTDGTITRLDRKNGNGSLDKDGYLIIKIKGKQYKAHRIAYCLYHGCFPNMEIDHINRNKLDNRIENLRLATRTMNTRNVAEKPNKDTGVVGVYIDRTRGLKKRYAIHLKKKTYRFNTLEEAIQKREEIWQTL